MQLKAAILEAARAESIPAGESGLWRVSKQIMSRAIMEAAGAQPWRTVGLNGAREYTWLFRYTEATAMALGECVMQDIPSEINKHMKFMLQAHGEVLVTGLGLGCVARGLLANPAVDRVTVVENSRDVLKLVGRHMPVTPRFRIVLADATQWVKHPAVKFDCAWHDLWTCQEEGDDHLQVVHMGLICDLIGKVKMQGAWEFPRFYRRVLRSEGVI